MVFSAMGFFLTPVPSPGATGQTGFTGFTGFFCCFFPFLPARQCQAMAGGREAGGHQVLVGVAFFYLTPVPFPEATGQAGFTGLTGSIFSESIFKQN